MPLQVAWSSRAPRAPFFVSRRQRAAAASASALPALNFQEQMIAGGLARGLSQTLLHPVDVLRTRLQARNVKVSLSPATFAKGISPQMLLAVPAGAVQFAAFETAKKKLEEVLGADANTRTVRMLLAGAMGACAAAVFRVPQEVLKQRIQADVYPNLAVALRETLKDGGVTGLYRGWLATLSRDVPWNAMSFTFHSKFKAVYNDVAGRGPSDGENLMLAGTAGALAAIIMTPVDVVKTRIMTEKVGQAGRGILQTFGNIVREEGAGTLMKGVVPRIVYLAPLAGITFSVYEAIAAVLKKRKSKAGSGSGPKVAFVKPQRRERGVAANRRVAFVCPRFSFDAL